MTDQNWKDLIKEYTGNVPDRVDVHLDPVFSTTHGFADVYGMRAFFSDDTTYDFLTTCQCEKKTVDCLQEVEFITWPPTSGGTTH